MHSSDVLVQVVFGDGTIITFSALVRFFFEMTISKVLRKVSWTWARHITHRAFVTIYVKVHMIIKQFFSVKTVQTFAAFVIACIDNKKFV